MGIEGMKVHVQAESSGVVEPEDRLWWEHVTISRETWTFSTLTSARDGPAADDHIPERSSTPCETEQQPLLSSSALLRGAPPCKLLALHRHQQSGYTESILNERIAHMSPLQSTFIGQVCAPHAK